jgi:hypothetical protein
VCQTAGSAHQPNAPADQALLNATTNDLLIVFLDGLVARGEELLGSSLQLLLERAACRWPAATSWGLLAATATASCWTTSLPS